MPLSTEPGFSLASRELGKDTEGATRFHRAGPWQTLCKRTGGLAMRRGDFLGRAWWVRVFVLVTFTLPAAGIAQPPEGGAPAGPENPAVTTEGTDSAAITGEGPDSAAITAAEQELTIPIPDLGPLGGTPNARPNYVVRLRVDGNLAGRVSALDSKGMLIPVRAGIQFVRDGRTVATVRSDEMGNFQAIGLQPGPYSVAATGRTMTADTRQYIGGMGVLVLPYDPTASPDELLLHLILMPAEDLSELVGKGEALLPPEAMIPGGFPMMGGGGGGEDALWGLLGLAGLAGMAASQGQGRGAAPPVASPFAPRR